MMIMSGAECRRLADKYRRLARGAHTHARRAFKVNCIADTIDFEERAMAYDKLIRKYEHLAKQRSS